MQGILTGGPMASSRDSLPRRAALALLLVLTLLCALPTGARAAAEDEGWLTHATSYFTIYYTAEGTEALTGYAAEVDGLYAGVAAIFDRGPTTPVALRLYATSAAYAGANP